jgi:hypothetical protein
MVPPMGETITTAVTIPVIKMVVTKMASVLAIRQAANVRRIVPVIRIVVREL